MMYGHIVNKKLSNYYEISYLNMSEILGPILICPYFLVQQYLLVKNIFEFNNIGYYNITSFSVLHALTFF